jgi:hypothetical protein
MTRITQTDGGRVRVHNAGQDELAGDVNDQLSALGDQIRGNARQPSPRGYLHRHEPCQRLSPLCPTCVIFHS